MDLQLVGWNSSINPATGHRTATLHLLCDYEPFYSDKEAGRFCTGNRVESVYVGDYDVSNLKPGMEIEIFYDKAVTTTKGTFQQVKKIEILK